MSRLILLPLLVALPLSANAQSLEATLPILQGQTDAADTSFDHLRDGDDAFLTHSNALEVVPGTGAACWNQGGGWTAENNYWRVFDLPAMGVTGELEIEVILLGLAAQTADNDQSVLFYTVEGEFTLETIELIGAVHFTAETDDSNTVIVLVAEPSVMVEAGSRLAVQHHIPHSQEQYIAFAGFNDLGQTGPSYVNCGTIEQPTDMATIGFPDAAWVLAVAGKDHPVSAEADAQVRSVVLGAAYPNPSTGMTTLPVELAEAQEVLITVHDLLGRQVSVVADEMLSAGSHFLQVDTRSLPSGTYVVRMVAGSTVLSNAIVSVR